MKTIKLSRDEETALREVISMAGKHLDMGEGKKHLDSILNQIQNAPDDTVMFMELVETEDEEDEDCGLDPCPQCDEKAWDGYICHACGVKNI